MIAFTLAERTMASKSVPTSRQCSASTCDLCAKPSGSEVKLVYCAYFAAILSVTFSPPPAIHSGIPLSCNGLGATIAPST